MYDDGNVPKICEFYGVAIYLYYRDHQPPHFHAIYAGSEALVAIGSLAILRGSLPPRATGLVMEWAGLRRADLERAWQKARNSEPLDDIQPLP